MKINIPFFQNKIDTQRENLKNAHMLFNTPLGQEVLAYLYKIADMDKTSFHETPVITAYKEGKKALMIDLLNLADTNTMELRLKILADEANNAMKETDEEY